MEPENKELTFEELFDELERTVARLEAGDLALEEALSLYKRGQELAGRCQQKLDEAVLVIEQLTDNGEVVEV